MNLFRLGNFKLASGSRTRFKIDCDALTDDDWRTLAAWIGEAYPFEFVEGVPTGGLKLAEALVPWSCPGEGLLIVDDVMTTGASMETQRAGRKAMGIVVFARVWPAPALRADWVTPLFRAAPGPFGWGMA